MLLEAQNLERRFSLNGLVLEVLRGVTLAVREGETAAITGASGSGKTTLLHVLGGLDQPTAGRVLYRGQDLYALSGVRRAEFRARRVGFVFQAYHLLPELSVLDNVLLPARSGCGPGRPAALRSRAQDLLEQVGLAERAAHRPNELSGGEQQRVALARALMNDPELLLADEPTGNLDSQTGAQILERLFALSSAGRRTLLLVTHNEELAQRCQRRFHLVDGRLQEGSPTA